MKTLCLWATVAVVALGSPLVSASTAVKFDGHWWGSHRSRARLLLIEGEIDGSKTQCYRMARTTSLLHVFHSHSTVSRRRMRALMRAWRKTYRRWSASCPYNRHFGVYRNLVSHFYRERQDAESVEVGQILTCYDDRHLKRHADALCIKGDVRHMHD